MMHLMGRVNARADSTEKEYSIRALLCSRVTGPKKIQSLLPFVNYSNTDTHAMWRVASGEVAKFFERLAVHLPAN